MENPSGDAGGRAHERRKWAVLLVHGVGDTQPECMIDDVAGAIRQVAPGLAEGRCYEVVPGETAADMARATGLPQHDPNNGPAAPHAELPAAPGPALKVEPLTPDPNDVWMRRAVMRRTGEEVVFAQVFWADLSRIRDGALRRLVGLFTLVLGLRHLADRAADQEEAGRLGVALRVTLRLASLLLRGPLLALYLFGFVTALAYSLVSPTWTEAGRPAALFLGLFGLLAAAVGLLFLWRRLFHAVAPWLWLAVVGVAAVVLAAVAEESPPVVRLGEWVNASNRAPALNLAFKKAPGQDGPSEADAPRLFDRTDSFPFYFATLLWTADLVFGGMAALMVIALALVLSARLFLPARTSLPLAVAYLMIAMQISLSVLLIAPASYMILYALRHARPDTVLTPLYNDLYLFVGFQFLLAVSQGVVAGCVFLARLRTAGRPDPAKTWRQRLIDRILFVGLPTAGRPDRKPENFPRLIVGGPVLLVTGLILSTFFILDVLDAFHLFDWVEALTDLFPTGTAWFAWFAWGAYFILLAPFVSWPYLPGVQNGAHIAADVINHFMVQDENFFSLGSPEDNNGSYAVRQTIQARFRHALTLLLSERPTHMIVLAHSQGTIIALEGIRLWADVLKAPHVTLVTMGSPLSHIYGVYFPDQYPPPADQNWRGLGNQIINVWKNVYRVDDYVGTEVNGDGNWPMNTQAPPGWAGAHTTYWMEEIFTLIRELFPGEPIAAPMPAPPATS